MLFFLISNVGLYDLQENIYKVLKLYNLYLRFGDLGYKYEFKVANIQLTIETLVTYILKN